MSLRALAPGLSNGVPTVNENNPPSTYAAQILDNLTSAQQQSVPDGKASFRQLLQEILDADNDKESSSVAFETNLDVNYKLICTTVKAGLHELFEDDPFGGKDDLENQALNSLAVICLTIKRSPEVLFITSFSQDQDAGTCGPLYLWLVPQILNIFCYLPNDLVPQGASKVLETIISFRRQTNSSGACFHPLQSYVEGLTQDLFFYLELSGGRGIQCPLIVPTIETVAEVYPEALARHDLLRSLQVRLHNPNETLSIALRLLRVILCSTNRGKTQQPKKIDRNLDFSWIIEHLVQAQPVLWPKKPIFRGRDFPKSPCEDFLEISVSCLEKSSGQFCGSTATSRLVSIMYGSIRLSVIDILESPGSTLDKALCKFICCLLRTAQRSEAVANAFPEDHPSTIWELCNGSNRCGRLSNDLQCALVLLLNYDVENNRIDARSTSIVAPIGFENVDLQDEFLDLLAPGKPQLSTLSVVRPPKRARHLEFGEVKPSEDLVALAINQVYDILGLPSSVDLEGLSQIISKCFVNIPEDSQCKLFEIFARIACTSASPVRQSQFDCPACATTPNDDFSSRVDMHSKESEMLLHILISIFKLPEFQRSNRPRVTAMVAVRKILLHCVEPDQLNLKASVFGQWALQCLRSSSRDLRVAAGRTLTVFLRGYVDKNYLRQNRVSALDTLRNLSESNELAIQETCILAWGQIAKVSSNDEKNIVLLRLFEYLGHSNTLICGLAYDELLVIFSHSSYIAMQTVSLFWRTIAVTVIKDLIARPQVVQYTCDILSIDVSAFLRLTQVHTIPFLILTKKHDILRRVAEASGSNTTVGALCTSAANMVAILSFLLVRPSTNVESTTMTLLAEASPDFNHVDLADLLRLNSIAVTAELLQLAAEETETQKPRAHQAIQLIAGLIQRRTGTPRGSARKSNAIGPFFELHVLGIMAILSDIVNDTKGPQPVADKRRCIGAIGEMVKLAKSHVSNALPQLCACLRSAMESEELINEAFMAWALLLTMLGEEDIGPLIDPTFAIIAKHWELFEIVTQQRAHEMISQLLKTHVGLIREVVDTIPSLASIPFMSKFEHELSKVRAQKDVKHRYQAFSKRCRNENRTVVSRALSELDAFLRDNQSFLHVAAISEQPDPVLAELTQSLLDACVRFSDSSTDIAILSSRCLGLVGCLDPTKVEVSRDTKEIMVLSNFGKADETIDFVVFFLREILVKAFLSATSSKAQGFLAYAMQELLRFCGLDTSVTFRTRDVQSSTNYRRWVALPQATRDTLTPFLTSKYFINQAIIQPECSYPIFRAGISHSKWLRDFVFDLLQKGCGENASMIFPVFRRTVRNQDIAIPDFLLPFAALNVILGGSEIQKRDIGNEFIAVLGENMPENEVEAKESIILCSQNVFHTLDYLARWMQEKRKEVANLKAIALRGGRVLTEVEHEMDMAQIQAVDYILSAIPAEMMSRRAVECKSFARALFHWEQYISQQKEVVIDAGDRLEPLYERLQDIYTQIDEPDGIEGISAHLQVLNIDQQVLEHRKAGRWTAVQSWYEILLTERPDDLDIQLNLLTSLKESGQYEIILNQITGFEDSHSSMLMAMPFAAEASWVTGKWEKLSHHLEKNLIAIGDNFDVGIGTALLALQQGREEQFADAMDKLRIQNARSLSIASTSSLQSCHAAMLRFHVLAEVDVISGVHTNATIVKGALNSCLNQRLDILGAYSSDKQYLLGLRRAAMQLSKREFSKLEVSSSWLMSARLARKGGFMHHAFNAVLHASQLGDESATIEHSRLLWKEGHHRKAIQSLEGAISANVFRSHDHVPTEESTATAHQDKQQQQNLLTARAHLLLAKWIDRAGQTQSDSIVQRYKTAINCHSRWEKGHYYLGKHYNKLLDSEKSKSPAKQAQTFITGETAKLVIENYLRSLAFGAKYIYQTLPRILTLWLELGTDVDRPLDPKYGNDENFRAHTTTQRRKLFGAVNAQTKKYIDRLPAFVFYTAFAQIVARICHTNQAIYSSLVDIVAKVVVAHPQQALWTLLAMIKSSAKDRSHRGISCMTKILESAKKMKTETAHSEVKTLMMQGQKLSDQLLQVCEGNIQGKPGTVSMARDLGFNHKTAPCRLVIPLESTLTAMLPPVIDNANMRLHRAFSKDTVTISTFLDDVLVLQSLQRPRKISIRGSDGRIYGLLCKPKDDLRKDQRLMEFNAMINRFLKKDAESSKRRLYIKTYAVTPLNEECGLIEWVDNLKTLRDILLRSYKQKNIAINYSELRILLDEASSDVSKLPLFTKTILHGFPPVFHEWFVEMFPEPSSWFAARLRYTRSCAVMSMVGHVLGLGDRHGENILFEEGNGGTFHVDFNCLFDKGLTFEKPELVPFRLTHNMVDAFGAYGYEGPFRKSCELTMGLLRGNEDTLMTILETFLYDPTTDFIGKKKKNTSSVPDTPVGVLESIRSKVRGLLPRESVPLSVEGYVHELIKQATDPMRLASMYIGWCAFF